MPAAAAFGLFVNITELVHIVGSVGAEIWKRWPLDDVQRCLDELDKKESAMNAGADKAARLFIEAPPHTSSVVTKQMLELKDRKSATNSEVLRLVIIGKVYVKQVPPKRKLEDYKQRVETAKDTCDAITDEFITITYSLQTSGGDANIVRAQAVLHVTEGIIDRRYKPFKFRNMFCPPDFLLRKERPVVHRPLGPADGDIPLADLPSLQASTCQRPEASSTLVGQCKPQIHDLSFDGQVLEAKIVVRLPLGGLHECSHCAELTAEECTLLAATGAGSTSAFKFAATEAAETAEVSACAEETRPLEGNAGAVAVVAQPSFYTLDLPPVEVVMAPSRPEPQPDSRLILGPL